MNQVCRDIFRAIYEGKWLKIEYRNKEEQVTRYIIRSWVEFREDRFLFLTTGASNYLRNWTKSDRQERA